MKELLDSMDKLPKIVKIILALPFFDIVWGLYRIGRGIVSKNYVTLIIGILWIIPGSFLCWIIDMVTIIATDRLLLGE